MQHKKINNFFDLIEALGGPLKVKETYNISIRQVYRWREGIISIPRKHWKTMAKQLKCSREELLELFARINEQP